MKESKQFLFTNEQFNDKVIYFKIIEPLIDAYRERNLKMYYYNVKSLFNSTAHFYPKRAQEIGDGLDDLESIITIPPPATMQKIPDYKRAIALAFRRIESLYREINTELQRTGFFKKSFVQDESGIARV